MLVSQSFVFISLIGIISFIKYVHRNRVELVSSHLRQSKIIAQISSEMISINQENFEHKMEKYFEIIGKLYKMDRIGVVKLSSDNRILTHHVGWAAPGVKQVAGVMDDIETAGDFWWNEQIRSKEMVMISDVDALDPAVCSGKKTMQTMGIKTFISLPIILNDRVYGFLLINCIERYENWRDDEKRMMSVLANMLGDAYFKIEKEKEITHMAYYDLLTGLPNRLNFTEKLRDNIEACKIKKTSLAVIFIDLDSFKSINDTLGHDSGDVLLKEIADNLKQIVTQNEFVARFGGDEFIIIMNDFLDKAQLLYRAQSIMENINQSVTIQNQDYYITASAGITVYPADGEDVETLVKNADLAMYEAKKYGRNGKNRFQFYSSHMKKVLEEQVYMTGKLKEALENEEFVLCYQPQISLKTNEIVGVEALVRWVSPTLGVIKPGVFIPLAEQSGLIHAIGKWVMDTAFKQNKAWQDQGLTPFRMAVNLSVEQFKNPDFVQQVHAIIEESGLDPSFVELEVTESIAIEEMYNIVEILTGLKALGLTLTLDDFGTYYSSLKRIKKLPIDRIKVAMEFVQGIAVNNKDEAITMSIITLTHSLGLKVIAEGIETKKQLDFLKKNNCDDIQGFYFCKPMPAEEIEKMLREQKVLQIS